jgi:uncharacterized protein (TIGR04255 family)
MDQPVAWTVPEIKGAGRHYAHAPIIEAVFDVDAVFSDEIAVADIERALEGEKEVSPIRQLSVTGGWDEDQEVTARRTIVGYSYRVLGDVQGVVRFRTTGFSFSLLSSYVRWEEFLSAAEGCWTRYKDLFKPSVITSIGVRFINRIDVGKEQFDVNDYLRTGVQISPYLSQTMTSFFAQVQIPLGQSDVEDCFATITTTAPARQGEDEGLGTALILDIDVSQKTQLSTADRGFDAEFTSVLDMLRRRKNEVFEACITDATRTVIS